MRVPRLPTILLLLCAAAGARLATTAGAAGVASLGVNGNASSFAPVAAMQCKIGTVQEKSRTFTVVRWVNVNNARAPGVIPEEAVALIKEWLARAKEIRANARTLQEVAVANRYEDEAHKLQFIREQEFTVNVPLGTKISKPTRSGLSALALNDRVAVTGIGSKFYSVGDRFEPGAILVTTDIVELSGGAVGSRVPAPKDAAPKDRTGKSPPPNARMVMARAGRIANLNPLSLQSDSGSVIALLIDTVANVGYVHDAEMNLRDLKEGDWIEVSGQLTGKGALSAQGVRVTLQTPLSLSGLSTPSTKRTVP